MSETQPRKPYVSWLGTKSRTLWHSMRDATTTKCGKTPNIGAFPEYADAAPDGEVCGQCRNRTTKPAPKGRAVNRGGGRFLAQWCPMPGHGAYSTSDGACPVDPCATVASVSGRSEVTVSLDTAMLAKVRDESGRTGISRSRLLTIAVESHAEILERFIATIPDG